MDQIITQYTIDDIYRVKTGKFIDNALMTSDLEEVKMIYPSEPENRITLIGCAKKVLKDEPGNPITPFCELSNPQDILKIDPDLIQVGYDSSKILDEDVRALVGGIQRVKVVPYEQMMPVEGLETEPIMESYLDLIKFLKDNEQSSKHCIRHGIRQRAPDVINPLEKLKDIQGLTSSEYMILIGTQLIQAFSEYEKL